MSILFIFLWKSGPWNYRKQVLNSKFPKSWQKQAEIAITDLENFSDNEQFQIQKSIQVMMSEKQWGEISGNTHDIVHFQQPTEHYKIRILAIGSWVSGYAGSPYFKEIEFIELGTLTGLFILSIQLEKGVLYSQKWYLPRFLEELGIFDFSFKYRGLIAEWANHIVYSKSSFVNHLENIEFRVELFPILFEVYLTERSDLFKVYPRLVQYFDQLKER